MVRVVREGGESGEGGVNKAANRSSNRSPKYSVSFAPSTFDRQRYGFGRVRIKISIVMLGLGLLRTWEDEAE